MHGYTFSQWLLFFYIYCFLGWCIESTYVSIKTKKLVNRGFLSAPLLPIYGTGAIIILVTTLPFIMNPILVFFMSIISATLLELVVGYSMESLFKVRYWDYSNNYKNYKGYICLKSSIFWGFLGILMTYLVHDIISSSITMFSINIVNIITIVISIFFVVDTIRSFNAAYGFGVVISTNAILMAELEELKKKLIEISESKDEIRVMIYEKTSDVKANFKEMLDTALSNIEIDDYIRNKIDDFKNIDIEIKDLINNWKEKTTSLKKHLSKIDNSKINILKRNPSAKSKFKFFLEIKKYIEGFDNESDN